MVVNVSIVSTSAGVQGTANRLGISRLRMLVTQHDGGNGRERCGTFRNASRRCPRTRHRIPASTLPFPRDAATDRGQHICGIAALSTFSPLNLVMEDEVYVVEGRVRRVRTEQPELDALREVARSWLQDPRHEAEREDQWGKGEEAVDGVLENWTRPMDELVRELLEDLLRVDDLPEDELSTLQEVFSILALFLDHFGVDIVPVIRECNRVLQRRARMREREEARRAFEREHRLPKRGTTARRGYVADRLLELAPSLIAQGLSNRKIARKVESDVGSSQRTIRTLLGELQRKGRLPRPREGAGMVDSHRG